MTASKKIVLVGDGAVGKSQWIKNMLGVTKAGTKYTATVCAEVHSFKFTNERGQEVRCNVWDCAGQAALRGLWDGHVVGADAAIIAFDASSPSKHDTSRLEYWLTELSRVCPGVPVAVMLCKADAEPISTSETTISPRADSGVVGVYRTSSFATGFNNLKPIEAVLHQQRLFL